MGGKIRSFLALPLFIFRLPLVFIGYIYKSCKYIGYSLPKQGGSYVYNRVNKTYKGVSVWYFGEDLEESDQTIITTKLPESIVRTPSPRLQRRRFSSSTVDFSIPLSPSMATRMTHAMGSRKESMPNIKSPHLYLEPSKLSKMTHSRSHDNILEEIKSKPFDVIQEGQILRKNVAILVTEPSAETPEFNSPLFKPISPPDSPVEQERSPLITPDPDPTEVRSTQVYEFKSDYWFTCLFVYHTDQKNENVSLVGDFNGWDTKAHKMYPCKEGYARCLDLLEGRYEYKFNINGNFKTDSHNEHISSSFQNSIIFVHIDPSKDHPPDPPSPPLLEYTRENSSFFYYQIHTPLINEFTRKHGIVERPIYVYLPLSYLDEGKSFPVVYALDGKSVFSSSVHGWHLDGMLDELWSKQLIREFILVAVPNGDDIQPGHRIKEYCPRDFHQSNAFLEYLVQIVKPFVDSNFRTLSDSENSFVLGSSLGGLCAFYLATRFPDIFSGAVCIAPSFWYHDMNDRSIFDILEETRNLKPKFRVYIDSGTGEEDNFYVTRSMAETLGDLDWIPEKDFLYHVDYSVPVSVDDYFTTHHHTLWRERIPDALKFILTPKLD